MCITIGSENKPVGSENKFVRSEDKPVGSKDKPVRSKDKPVRSKDKPVAIAYAQVEPSDRECHINLLKKNEEDLLTAEEKQELAALRLAADHLMLRKAYAWSILRWRGQRIPPLQDLPVSL